MMTEMRAAQLKAEFEEFHKLNPHVYAALVRIARQVQAAGKDHYGAQAIFERLRWISTFETQGDPYKINNNYAAFYVRLIRVNDPELGKLFRTRHSYADGELR